LIQEAGGKINKKDLPARYQNLSQLLDSQGNVTEQSIEKYIHELPKVKYNVSYGEWEGAQRHDPTKKQKVMQLNLTDEHIKQIKDKGLYPTFRKIFESSKYSSHPIRPHTIGWARID